MAPEVLRKKKYDVKADVYSFAVLAYNILTGKEPYSDFENIWGEFFNLLLK